MAIIVLVLFFVAALQAVMAQEMTKTVLDLAPVIIPGSGNRACPSMERRKSIQQALIQNVYDSLFNDSVVPECGAGLWYQTAHLDMSDPSQECPSEWTEYTINSNGDRACGRPTSNGARCTGKNYVPDRQYSRVCGRVIGYQYGSPDGFSSTHLLVSQTYMDGVSITHGTPRTHIWSYVAGVTEDSSLHFQNNCPCSEISARGNGPSSAIGDNYYCESGNPTDTWSMTFYQNDPLWDGQQCEGTCCTGDKSPPWFSVQLPSPTTDDIAVRICGSESTSNENTPIQLLELYVQ